MITRADVVRQNDHAHCTSGRWRNGGFRQLPSWTVSAQDKCRHPDFSSYKGSRHHAGNTTEAGSNLAAGTTTLLSR